MSNKPDLDAKGISDNFKTNMEYAHCTEHKDCNFFYRFRRLDEHTICVESSGNHATEKGAEAARKSNLIKYGSLIKKRYI